MFYKLQFLHLCHCLLQDGKTAEDLAIAEQQEHVAVLLAKLKKVRLLFIIHLTETQETFICITRMLCEGLLDPSCTL